MRVILSTCAACSWRTGGGAQSPATEPPTSEDRRRCWLRTAYAITYARIGCPSILRFNGEWDAAKHDALRTGRVLDERAARRCRLRNTRPEAPDARWRFIPWDFNASFGQGASMQRRAPDYWTGTRFGRANRLFERIMSEPTLMLRFGETVQGVWTEDEIALTLERFASEVEAAAKRDELRWGEARHAYFSDRSDWTSPAEELDYLRTWMPARWRLFTEQLDE